MYDIMWNCFFPKGQVIVQVINTKLSVPPLRTKLVERSGLIQKLNRDVERGFVLVSAPAGYGKSTLLSAWLTQVDYTKLPSRIWGGKSAMIKKIASEISMTAKLPERACFSAFLREM